MPVSPRHSFVKVLPVVLPTSSPRVVLPKPPVRPPPTNEAHEILLKSLEGKVPQNLRVEPFRPPPHMSWRARKLLWKAKTTARASPDHKNFFGKDSIPERRPFDGVWRKSDWEGPKKMGQIRLVGFGSYSNVTQ
jgi:hypothetical protein